MVIYIRDMVNYQPTADILHNVGIPFTTLHKEKQKAITRREV